MYPITGTLPAAIRIYWFLATFIMQKATSLKIFLFLVMKVISSRKSSHVKPLMEAVVANAKESNTRMNMASESATRINLL